MAEPDGFAAPQHMAAEAVAEALESEGSFREVTLYKGPVFSIIHAFIETPTTFRKLRIEVYPED